MARGFCNIRPNCLDNCKTLSEEVVSRHGVPAELLSDRGKSFLSLLMQEVCSVLGVKKVNTTAYHPQTDGLVERFNRTLINMLAKRGDQIGISTFLTFSLHIEPVFRS